MLKEEYQPNSIKSLMYCFCYYSKRFEKAWESNQQEKIMALAEKFLGSKEGEQFAILFRVGSGFLFIPTYSRHDRVRIEDKIEVRKQFLEWMISKCK